MRRTRVNERGICCDSCQEEVNIHGCAKCGKMFEDGDEVYCRDHSHHDAEHYHLGCKPEE